LTTITDLIVNANEGSFDRNLPSSFINVITIAWVESFNWEGSFGLRGPMAGKVFPVLVWLMYGRWSSMCLEV
jgi:hypothetical protein